MNYQNVKVNGGWKLTNDQRINLEYSHMYLMSHKVPYTHVTVIVVSSGYSIYIKKESYNLIDETFKSIFPNFKIHITK